MPQWKDPNENTSTGDYDSNMYVNPMRPVLMQCTKCQTVMWIQKQWTTQPASYYGPCPSGGYHTIVLAKHRI